MGYKIEQTWECLTRFARSPIIIIMNCSIHNAFY